MLHLKTNTVPIIVRALVRIKKRNILMSYLSIPV